MELRKLFFDLVGGNEVPISSIKGRRHRIVDCFSCDRDGHGPNYLQCKEHTDELRKFDVLCWRPRGVILVWDERVETE